MTNSVKNLANLLREDCKKLVEVSKADRDEKGNYLTYEEVSKKKEFFCAYKKAQLHFNQLVRVGGEKGDKIAHIVFGKNAHECVRFRCIEEVYLKNHPEDGGFFNVDKFYDFCRKTPHEEKIAAKNAEFEAKRVKAVRETGRRNRKIAAIVIVAIIAVVAFAIAVYKKGLKPVLKAIAFGACCVAVIFAFRKAQETVLERIHKKFYGNK